MISDTAFDLDLGADSPLRKDDPAQYWEAVRADLSTLIGELPIHKLILLGSQSGDRGLRTAIIDVSKEKGGNESLDVLMKSTDRKDMGGGLWFGSRAALLLPGGACGIGLMPACQIHSKIIRCQSRAAYFFVAWPN
jgi:hypothetical protein